MNALSKILKRLFVLSIVMLMICVLTLVAQPVRMQEAETHSLIAFESGRVYTMNPDGTARTQIGDFTGDSLAWSPDGSRLAFVREDSTGLDQIWVMDSDGRNVRQLTTLELSSSDSPKNGPKWSPDGQWIAFTLGMMEPREVFMVTADGSQVLNVTNTSGVDENFLDWSPDGQRLLIRVLDGSNPGVYLVNLDGSGSSLLPYFPPRTISAVWSPDGSHLALGAIYGGNGELYVMESDGSNLVRLTNNDVSDGYPTWSPDGQYIAYCSGAFPVDIYRMRSDGTEVVNLTHNEANNTTCEPDWSPLLPGPAPTAVPPTPTPAPILEPSDLECPDAPPSRLNIGMSAAVVMPSAEEPERQNLRVRDAVEGAPIGLLDPGQAFRIVGGPECGANGQRWWEIDLLDGSVRGWSVEGFAPDDYLMVPF